MKSIINILLTLFSFVFISSCTMEKRVHMSGYHVEYHKALKKSSSHAGQANRYDTNSVEIEGTNANISSKTNRHGNDVVNEPLISHTTNIVTDSQNKSTPTQPENDLTASTSSGIAPLLNVTAKEQIRTGGSETTHGQIQSSSKLNLKKALVDRYKKKLRAYEADGRKTHWGATAGMVTGIVGLFFFGILLGACAIVFSAVALSAIKRNPETYKGKGMAIAGLVCGIVGIALFLIILGALVASA